MPNLERFDDFVELFVQVVQAIVWLTVASLIVGGWVIATVFWNQGAAGFCSMYFFALCAFLWWIAYRAESEITRGRTFRILSMTAFGTSAFSIEAMVGLQHYLDGPLTTRVPGPMLFMIGVIIWVCAVTLFSMITDRHVPAAYRD